MPQGDFVTFPSTVLGVALTFVGGYLFFIGWWVPRLLLTLKIRSWLNHPALSVAPVSQVTNAVRLNLETFTQAFLFVGLAQPQIVMQRIIGRGLIQMYPENWWEKDSSELPVEPSYWPEKLILFVLFLNLIYMIVRWMPDTRVKVKLQQLKLTSVRLPDLTWTQPIATLLNLWIQQRSHVYSHFRSQVNFWTAGMITTVVMAVPSVFSGSLQRRLKIVNLRLLKKC